MAKAKRMYGCTECGSTFPKWAGQCGECGAWNTLTETMVESGGAAAPSGRTGWTGQQAQIKTLAEVSVEEIPRFSTASSELDRVLGGGLVDGSVVLIGGDPGIGKSTILLQTLCNLAKSMPALYVTGEESQQQVAMRARRLGLPQDQLRVMTETCIETIIATARQEKAQGDGDRLDPDDFFYRATAIGSGGRFPGSRKCGVAGALCQTKRHGDFPRGPCHQRRRAGWSSSTGTYGRHRSVFRRRIRWAPAPAASGEKNRFGAVNELGVFGMTDKGLKEVSNPSAIFF